MSRIKIYWELGMVSPVSVPQATFSFIHSGWQTWQGSMRNLYCQRCQPLWLKKKKTQLRIRGGQGGHAPPPVPVKTSHKKGGRHYISRFLLPPPPWQSWIRCWNNKVTLKTLAADFEWKKVKICNHTARHFWDQFVGRTNLSAKLTITSNRERDMRPNLRERDITCSLVVLVFSFQRSLEVPLFILIRI